GVFIMPPVTLKLWSEPLRCSAATCPGVAPSVEVRGVPSAPIGMWIFALDTASVAISPPIEAMRARRPVASSTPPAYAPVSVARAVRVASIDDGSGVYHQSRSLVPLYALAPFVGAPERLPTVTAPLAPVMSPANVKSGETEPSRMLE